MRIIPSVAVMTVGLLLGLGSLPAFAADDDGVALGILYDTSGSMAENVPNSHGSSSPKYVIANRALLAVVKQIQAYTTNGVTGAPRKVDVGLFTFSKDGAQAVVKLGAFDPGAIQNWTTNFSKPSGATPLGNAGIPSDIAAGVVFLASDESRFVTGTELIIDGGVMAG